MIIKLVKDSVYIRLQLDKARDTRSDQIVALKKRKIDRKTAGKIMLHSSLLKKLKTV